MAKGGLTVVVDRLAGVVAGIASLASQRVMVGVPSSRAGRQAVKGQTINNAALAYIHNRGAPEAGIPARPFMEPGIASAKDRIIAALEVGVTAALDGKPDIVLRQYHRAGLIAQAAIRSKITTGPFIPLKPATLAARRRRGHTGTKPLIESGQLRASINYVIVQVGKGTP